MVARLQFGQQLVDEHQFARRLDHQLEEFVGRQGVRLFSLIHYLVLGTWIQATRQENSDDDEIS